MNKQYVIDWKSVNDLPEGDTRYVLVVCRGGKMAITLYSPNWEYFRKCRYKSWYSRKHHGKNSRYFELCHKLGCEIMYWAEKPEVPSDVYDNAAGVKYDQ